MELLTISKMAGHSPRWRFVTKVGLHVYLDKIVLILFMCILKMCVLEMCILRFRNI